MIDPKQTVEALLFLQDKQIDDGLLRSQEKNSARSEMKEEKYPYLVHSNFLFCLL